MPVAPSKQEPKRTPKTALDARFLAVVDQAMRHYQLPSQRAVSRAIGYHRNHISLIHRGVISATPAAWDALIATFPLAGQAYLPPPPALSCLPAPHEK